MSKIQILVILLVLSVVMVFGGLSCDPTVSQEKYDRVNNKLSETKGQIAVLQSELAEAEKMQVQYEELTKDHVVLKQQYDIKMNEIETIESKLGDLTTQYEDLEKQHDDVVKDLTAKYEDLKKQYDVIQEGGVEISEEEVEQALLELINQERKNNGLNELLWGKNLYKFAEWNSSDMERRKAYQYSEYAFRQEVFWAAGYSTVDRIANGALLTWRTDLHRYEQSVLNNEYAYGAVGAYKSGDIFYITYITDRVR